MAHVHALISGRYRRRYYVFHALNGRGIIVEPPLEEEFDHASPVEDVRSSEDVFTENAVLVKPDDLSSITEVGWGAIADTETFDKLMAALNPRGFREGPLKKNLEIHQKLLTSLMKPKPVPRPKKVEQDVAALLRNQAETDMSQLEFKLSDGLLTEPEYDDDAREKFGEILVSSKTPQE